MEFEEYIEQFKDLSKNLINPKAKFNITDLYILYDFIQENKHDVDAATFFEGAIRDVVRGLGEALVEFNNAISKEGDEYED